MGGIGGGVGGSGVAQCNGAIHSMQYRPLGGLERGEGF